MARTNWGHNRKHGNVSGVFFDRTRSIILRCGCDAVGPPKLSNPERWWCCGGWQKKKP